MCCDPRVVRVSPPVEEHWVMEVDKLVAFQESQNFSLESRKNLLDNVHFVVNGVLVPLLSLFGMIGNIIAIRVVVYTNLGLSKTFRILLCLLLCFDTSFLVLINVLFTMSQLSGFFEVQIYPHLVPFCLPLMQTVLTGCSYTVLAIALERSVNVNTTFTWSSGLSV